MDWYLTHDEKTALDVLAREDALSIGHLQAALRSLAAKGLAEKIAGSAQYRDRDAAWYRITAAGSGAVQAEDDGDFREIAALMQKADEQRVAEIAAFQAEKVEE